MSCMRRNSKNIIGMGIIMKSAVWIIMKKELVRFFGDRRLVLTTVFLPGIMIFLMYQFMGTAIESQLDQRNEPAARIEAVGLPDSVQSLLAGQEMEIRNISEKELEQAKERVQEQETELCLTFSGNFDREVSRYSIESGEAAPAVQIYYNSAENESLGAYQTVVQLLEDYEGTLCNKFDVNPGEGGYDLATREDTVGSMFASLLPMLLLLFLYEGCIAVAPESIAGEKERGTIATLLVTPVRRGNIVLGKIGALSVIALLSGISSATGTILSLPKIMQAEGGTDAGMQANVYRLSDYLLLAVVILSTVLFMVTLISMISAYANTIKEAQTFVTPFMVLVMLVGITAVFGEDAKTEWQYYLLPLYNSVQCMVGIFSFKIILSRMVMTVAVNLVFSGIGVWVLSRMFHSERIMFS